MAEVVGLIASIGALAGAGFKLANLISTLSDGWTVANEQVKAISADTRAVAVILHQIKKRLEQTASASACGTLNEQVAGILGDVVSVCQADIEEIERSLVPLLVSEGVRMMFKQKVLWLFAKSRISTRRASLESIKGTLNLFLHAWDLMGEDELGDYLEEEVKQLVAKPRSVKKLFMDAERIEQAVEKAFEGFEDPGDGLQSRQLTLKSSESHEARTIASSNQTAVESEAGTVGDLAVATQVNDDDWVEQPSPQMSLESISDDHFLVIADHMRLDRDVVSMALVALRRDHSSSTDANVARRGAKQAERSENTTAPAAEVPDPDKKTGTPKDRQTEPEPESSLSDSSQAESTRHPRRQASYVPPEYSSTAGSDSHKADDVDGNFFHDENLNPIDASGPGIQGSFNPSRDPRSFPQTDGKNYIYHGPDVPYSAKRSPPNPYSEPYFNPQSHGPRPPPQSYATTGLYEGGAYPGGYWGPPPPPDLPSFLQPQEPNPTDVEISKLQAELRRLKLEQERKEQEDERRAFEEEIERKTVEKYEIREEARRKAMEEAKREFEKAKAEAERAAREKIDKERKHEAAMVARIHREARESYEAEILAKEKEKKGLRRFW